MKSFNTFVITVLAIIAAIFVLSNIIINSFDTKSDNQYKVDISRAENIIATNGIDSLDYNNYPNLISVTVIKDNKDFSSENMYKVKEINGVLYRFDYKINTDKSNISIIVNVILAIITLIVIFILFYIRQQILKPFSIISNLPFELSKGNLTSPVKEQNQKYFGKFNWGLDLLREKLELQKQKELQLQKEKKTLILSLSHDIKTPLGVIELYAKAIQKNLYKDEKKQQEIAVSIIQKCSEIKEYVSKITTASNEDIVNIEVCCDEYYLSKIVNNISDFYTEKLKMLKIDFKIDKYNDCLLKLDIDRSIEVLQNIIENAIKYGDGKEIKISFEQEENYMLITISNSGCTLSENELPHIFESFWRGSNIGSNSGSGLGLYICRQLMTQMDGEIFAKIKYGYMCVTTVFQMV